MENNESRSEFVAIVGRPNVGKSTLLNYLIGERLAIVTPKPETTRTRITGILTRGATQYVFFDTPGIHLPRHELGSRMNQTARSAAKDGDLILFLFEPAGDYSEAEQSLLNEIRSFGSPVLAVINKADTLKDHRQAEERIRFLKESGVFEQVLCISSKTGAGVQTLLDVMEKYAQPGPHFFADDAFTDLPEKTIAAEIVREKLLLHLQQELPHGTAVTIDRFADRPDGDLTDIQVTITCEKNSHKGMIIGKQGSMLKIIATEARMDIEKMLGRRVNLQCWVRVREGWRDSKKDLKELGFQD